MIPAPMPAEHLAAFLRRAADEIERNASDEGSVVWGIPGAGVWDVEFAQDEDAGMYVMAMVRNGNDRGQGGAWVVGEAEPT